MTVATTGEMVNRRPKDIIAIFAAGAIMYLVAGGDTGRFFRLATLF